MFSSYAGRSQARWNSLWRVRTIEGLRTEKKNPAKQAIGGGFMNYTLRGFWNIPHKSGEGLCLLGFPYQRQFRVVPATDCFRLNRQVFKVSIFPFPNKFGSVLLRHPLLGVWIAHKLKHHFRCVGFPYRSRAVLAPVALLLLAFSDCAVISFFGVLNLLLGVGDFF